MRKTIHTKSVSSFVEMPEGSQIALAHSNMFYRYSSHNHSPKAGQGLNLGLGDGFNLAWKLAMFDRGLAQQSILLTYQTERRTLAQSVIELDAQLTRAVTTFKAAPADGSSSATQEYMKLREQNAAVISGLGGECFCEFHER
ncbi:FAD binding domain-containing protein [Jimgerdemannia flammicorona]|uniref:FAD binding domain-containing protein n=1 Tax=Jimgerdemannia flammicorona TaxID=994334 RepID=A0A433DN30_9FUNG|nr:FAD binding domain-containing protein [Jimgerdemannia flammicorona]